VGIVAQGVSGSLYLGFNIEFPGHALGFAVHGEQAALSSAYMHGEQGVLSIALTAAPCGHCRQFMNELAPDGNIEILVEGSAPTKLAALLPLAFGPKDLGRKEGAFPVKRTNLIAANGSTPADTLFQAALDAARSSYAPYSGAYSGVAIGTRSGRIYSGSYLENVAFNPSLSPLQTALVQLILAGEDYRALARVALAEISRAKISQRSATEAVLSAIAPSVRLEILAAENKS
jgi:cytidine deaminase